ncbi:uncharacterized protein LOC143364452 [Halictus rubicundus]|uniref:uncharacterized protein LOC143364452 n=1 Tax=Halictus rubicundus TaxID=77578 RepID=UPI004036A282
MYECIHSYKSFWFSACSHSVGEESQGEGQEDEIHSDKQCSIGEQTENNCCKGCQKRDGMLKTLILQNHLTRVLLTKVLAEVRALKEITQINNAGGSRSGSFLNKFPNLKFPLKSLEEDYDLSLVRVKPAFRRCLYYLVVKEKVVTSG